MALKIYLAGPDVFRLNAVTVLQAKKEKLEALGYEVLTPLDNAFEQPSALQIANANLEMIHSCDIVLADVQPFRGTEPDSGTVFEIGFAAALGKAIYTYNNPEASYKARLESWDVRFPECLFAPEAFGLKQNLMISCNCAEYATFEEFLDSHKY
jgi:nucleoside 2-deoxyribosyltransferase